MVGYMFSLGSFYGKSTGFIRFSFSVLLPSYFQWESVYRVFKPIPIRGIYFLCWILINRSHVWFVNCLMSNMYDVCTFFCYKLIQGNEGLCENRRLIMTHS